MQPLISPGEPAAFELVNADGAADLVLVCDHASNRIPGSLQALGLTCEELATHIAWDRGALDVARYLSRHLDAPLLHSNYSRLVIDCNRHPHRADSIATSSAGIPVPGNQGLSTQEAVARRETFFDPYHDAIDRVLLARRNRLPFLLSIHSFAPALNGVARSWPIGVCYQEPSATSEGWLRAVQETSGVAVGDNQPFTVEADVDYTIPTNVNRHGVAAIMLEIRDDGIASTETAAAWGEIIGKAWRVVAEGRGDFHYKG